MRLLQRTDVVVVGAGQAGLAMSWHLQRAGRDHVLLDRRERLGGGWQDRWDAFRLVTPSWTASFPGCAYDGPEPDGFMTRDEIAGRVARYAGRISAPVVLGVEVRRLHDAGGGFRLETDRGVIRARAVIVATGGYHAPRVPSCAAGLSRRVASLHTHDYRNERQLPPGAVLVVGSGQSGVQIAEELTAAGRRVFLSVGSAGRAPRRYRGQDLFVWLRLLAARGEELGTPLPCAAKLADPRRRRAANPHVSGQGGGHDVDLRRMAAGGVGLTGRLEGVDGHRLRFAPDLRASLAAADRYFDERFRPLVDAAIERAGIAAPPDDRVPFRHDPPEITHLDLAREGVTTVLWASGYRLDYGWLELPVLDEMGFPRQERGVTSVPGLYFVGSLWQHTQASATLFGLDLEARALAERTGLLPSDDAAVATTPADDGPGSGRR